MSFAKREPIGSPTHCRRMVVELNALPDGFYHGGTRYRRARYSKGKLQARSVSGERWTSITPECRDAYGQPVVASQM